MTGKGPLSGVRVVDASTVLAGPLTAQILGDFGADVVKIEHPKAGDSFRHHGAVIDGHGVWWKTVGRNKRTVGLYLGDAEGAEIFKRIVREIDVLVENFRPGTLEKWGLGPDVLHEINPRLVIARITGFGQSGPYASRAGFGTLAEAMSGFAAVTGEPDGPPTLPPMGLADTLTGYAAVSAVMMALYHRDTVSGRGQVIDLSLLEPMMTAVGPGPSVFALTGRIPPRVGNRSVANAPRNTYRTADGRWVAISTSATPIAERVMRLVGRGDVVSEPWFASAAGRVAHVDVLDGAVADWIAARSFDDVVAAFEQAEAAVAPIYTAADLCHDPHVRSTDMLVEVADEHFGSMLMGNVLFRMSETPGSIRFTGRPLGADTDDVLGEVGVDATTIAKLRGQGVLA
ncbi:MAG: acyl-CoA transferase [Acidimicrobiales bacterium mtb01]|nr:CoA transferase [Actinomycetota bacterium]TEX45050.1 MAG: acyl-CoA transferase [Acidimicrobiales bacterium mtb01]